jgi:hypothetical protein
MYFCPNCNNVFDITKGATQNGGSKTNSLIGGANNEDFEKLISKLLKNEDVSENEIINISIDDLIKNQSYKKLKNKQREYIYNKIQDLLPNEKKNVAKEEIKHSEIQNKAYFICNNCGNRKPIDPGTLIFSKVSSDVAQSYSSSDVLDMKYSDILPRTRKYICPNSKCESHNNPDKREAIFFRMNNAFKIKHICQACNTVF